MDDDAERALVEAIHRQAHRQAAEEACQQALPPVPEPATIPYTELPEGNPDSPLCQEWNTYRREVGRLLAEGHEGKFVVIKGEKIIGIWDSRSEARGVGIQKYAMEPFLTQEIRRREPLLRGPILRWRH